MLLPVPPSRERMQHEAKGRKSLNPKLLDQLIYSDNDSSQER
jgi:hypothetical protein